MPAAQNVRHPGQDLAAQNDDYLTSLLPLTENLHPTPSL